MSIDLVGRIDAHLLNLLQGIKCVQLKKAMAYCALGGGKRLRPILLLECALNAGSDYESAMPFAAALELIHTYSLIHDDLPCMDDDDYRRGKPSCHRKFGEGIAVLTGDALLNFAYEIMLENAQSNPLAARAALIIAKSAGAEAMIGGQAVDISLVAPTKEQVRDINLKKTAALFSAASEAGAVLAGQSKELCDYYQSLGEDLGLLFQYKDDLADKMFHAFSAKELQAEVERLANCCNITLDKINAGERLRGVVAAIISK